MKVNQFVLYKNWSTTLDFPETLILFFPSWLVCALMRHPEPREAKNLQRGVLPLCPSHVEDMLKKFGIREWTSFALNDQDR